MIILFKKFINKINNKTSENARKKIIKMLNKTLLGSYDIIDQKAGIRPSTLDRRPLIGRHPIYKQLYILNGLGTRGVLLAPYLSKCLLNHIYFNKSIHSDVDINRIL